MHEIYIPQEENWSKFLNCDDQIGYGSSYFEGYPFQHFNTLPQYGDGIGDVFKTIYRFLLPLGKKLGQSLGEEGLQTAHRVLSNVVADPNNKNVKEIFTKELKRGAKNLLTQASDSQLLKGEGRRKKKSPKKRLAAFGGPMRKRQDIFGKY